MLQVDLLIHLYYALSFATEFWTALLTRTCESNDLLQVFINNAGQRIFALHGQPRVAAGVVRRCGSGE